MKSTSLLVALAVASLWVCPAFSADPAPLFEPEPPEAGAAALVEAYLPLLVSGDFDQALAMNDLRGMRQYLLERRLNDLKTKNPELTTRDLDEMSAQMQMNDLNPARLLDILRQVMIEGGYEGMKWRIRGYAPAPATIGGHLVRIEAQTAAGQDKPILLGIKKLGDHWWVAPEVVEEMLGRTPLVQVVQDSPPPGAVTALVDSFWTRWQAGEFQEAYSLLGADYRAKVPLLTFLQQAQDFIAAAGVPNSWQIVKAIETAPATYWIGVKVQGSTATKPTIIQFKKTGQTWIMEDIQFEMPRSAPPVAAPPTEPAPLRTNLKPDLKPAVEPTAPAPTMVILPVPSAVPAPAKPVGPVGPDAPLKQD